MLFQQFLCEFTTYIISMPSSNFISEEVLVDGNRHLNNIGNIIYHISSAKAI